MLEKFLEKNKTVLNAGDYRDNEGYLVCGQCQIRKEYKFTLGNETKLVRCMCKCEEAKLKQEEEQELIRQQQIAYKRRLELISPNYRNIFLTNSDIPLPKIESYINKFKEMKNQNIGIMLYGNVGNGKTFMASCIANELCKQGYKVIMLHITEALNIISQFKNDDFLNEISEVDLLIIDDFGASRTSDYQNEQVIKLIDRRYSSRKPIIITTNLTRKDLVENKNDISLSRAYDRLLEMTVPLNITSKGRRISLAKSKQEIFNKILEDEEVRRFLPTHE